MIANDLHFGGSRRRARAQALVNSILGAQAPRVYVQGTQFAHRATWMDRVIIGIVCAWARLNPGKRPGEMEAASWAAETQRLHRNLELQGQDCIVLAALPPMGDQDLEVVSDGGALHETAHGLYTRRHAYTTKEVMDLIVDRWDEVPDWGYCERALLDITNVVNDPQIERALMGEYPGTTSYIFALRRWSWNREARALETAHANPEHDKLISPYQVATSLLIALGHDDVDVPERTEYIEVVRKVRPAVAHMVEHGRLREVAESMRTIAVDDCDEPLRIAIRFVSLVSEALGEDGEAGIRMPGVPGAITCPQCGSANVRAILLPSTADDRARGTRRARCSCGSCGTLWSTRVQPSEGDSEGCTVVDLDEVAGAIQSLAAAAKTQRDQKSNHKKPGKGQPGSEKGEKGEKGEEADNAAGQEAGAGGPQDPDKDESDAGNPAEADPSFEVATEVLGKTKEDETPTQVVTNVLDDFVQEVWKEQEQAAVGAAYRPYAPGCDEVVVPEPRDRSAAIECISKLRDTAASETQVLREGLRRLVVGMRRTRVLHGVENGVDLSERMLADVGAAISVGEPPQRPWKRRMNRVDPRFSAIVVLDQSFSMENWMSRAVQTMLAIVDPIDDLGYPVAAIGFQDKEYHQEDVLPLGDNASECHRSGSGVRVFAYKRFEEPLSLVQHRFASAKADGGTPMAEGIQAALEWMAVRRETTRFIFVVTDGCPNRGTESVIVSQVAETVRRGILIVGVGVGAGTEKTIKLFHPTGVSVKTFSEVPDVLLNVISDRLRAMH